MSQNPPVALITGGGMRIGAALVEALHEQGYAIALHYRRSAKEAQALSDALCQKRPGSVLLLAAEAHDIEALESFPKRIEAHFGRLDVLINNASSFYPTPLGSASLQDWNALLDSNVKMAFFLSQALAPLLRVTEGTIINITDIHAVQPLKTYSLYSLGKAALQTLTAHLALELAPTIRVNAIAPGWVLANPLSDESETRLNKIPLKRIGSPQAIIHAVKYLLTADYVTGHTLQVDGGRHLA